MHVGDSDDKKGVLQDLLDMGMVLVALDARADGVDVPAHLERDPQLRLNLSFRFGLPMSLDTWGIAATLTFGGVPYACRFPWKSIYLLVSHVNGEPYLFPEEVPPELLAQVGVDSAAARRLAPRAGAAPARRGRPQLRVVSPDEALDGDGDDAGDDGTPEAAPAPAATARKRREAAANKADAPAAPVAPGQDAADATGPCPAKVTPHPAARVARALAEAAGPPPGKGTSLRTRAPGKNARRSTASAPADRPEGNEQTQPGKDAAHGRPATVGPKPAKKAGRAHKDAAAAPPEEPPTPSAASQAEAATPPERRRGHLRIIK